MIPTVSIIEANTNRYAPVAAAFTVVPNNSPDFDEMNAVYESYFIPSKLPARTCVGVTALAVGASIEIDLIAKY